MLELKNLCVDYGARRALSGISLSVEAGSVLGLIGPNGAGKTTLIRAASGVMAPSAGQVRLAGQDLSGINPGQRARWVAVVPQARSLPAGFSGYEMVSLGRTPHINWFGQLTRRDRAAIEQAMERTDTRHLAARLVGEMSGGEQQRLLIARALAQSAPVLLLDEPTTSLDLQYQVSLLQLVHTLAHRDNLAVLMAMHDLNLVARYTDRVALMVAGQVRALGAPEAVLTGENLSHAYRLPLRVLPAGDANPLLVLPAE